ncbi:MAG: hypothetical protein L3J29_01130 [Cyclobacteriaceae bacterium]|nr:hypothetical protein [Cyclobacteriaceae bacterium]
MRKIFLATLIGLPAFLISCNDQPTCIPEQTDLIKIAFIDIVGNPKNIILTSLTVDNSGDSFPVFNDTISNVIIPLNPLDSSIIIRFYQDTISNYIALSYTTIPVVLNPKCELEMKFDFLKMDSTDFEDVDVVESAISLQTARNIEVTH